jgi:RNA polymerase sigma-70 factor, ECF subfamily
MSTHPQSFSPTSTPIGIRPYPSRKKCASLMEPRKPERARGSQHFSSCNSSPAMDFPSLYDTYRRRIYSQCFYMLRNHGDAEDAAQEVFLQLFKKVHTFRGESKFSTWLHRLTTNCVLMEMRKKRRRWHEISPEDTPLALHDADDSVDASLDHFRAPGAAFFDKINISTVVAKLPVGFQKIFQMHDIEGYTHSEIASFLKIQVGTSKSQLHKARHRLRGLLENSRVSSEVQ